MVVHGLECCEWGSFPMWKSSVSNRATSKYIEQLETVFGIFSASVSVCINMLTSSPVWHVTSIYMNHTFLIYWCGWTWFFSHRNKTHNSCVPKNRPCYTATQPGSGQNEQKYLDLLRRHSESLLATQRADMHNYIYTHYIYIYIYIYIYT